MFYKAAWVSFTRRDSVMSHTANGCIIRLRPHPPTQTKAHIGFFGKSHAEFDVCHIPKIEFYESSRRNIYGYADIYVGVNGYIEIF